MSTIILPQTALYWLAGLLEGEGSFLAPPPSAPNQPLISISMTDRDVIEKVSAIFENSSISSRRWPNAEWKTAYITQLRGIRAVELMRVLRPLMGQRRQYQIDAALAAYGGSKKSKLGLTDALVLEIYRRANSGEKYQSIADDTGVGYSTVADIKIGRSWSHLTKSE